MSDDGSADEGSEDEEEEEDVPTVSPDTPLEKFETPDQTLKRLRDEKKEDLARAAAEKKEAARKAKEDAQLDAKLKKDMTKADKLEAKRMEQEERERVKAAKMEAARIAKIKAAEALLLSKEEQAAAKIEAARVLKDANDKLRAEKAEKARHKVTDFDKFSYVVSHLAVTTKLRFDITMLHSTIAGKKKTMGPALFDALMEDKKDVALAHFIECKKIVDDLLHKVSRKEAELQQIVENGESETLQKPKTPAEKEAMSGK
jgi:hypothetical protein